MKSDDPWATNDHVNTNMQGGRQSGISKGGKATWIIIHYPMRCYTAGPTRPNFCAYQHCRGGSVPLLLQRDRIPQMDMTRICAGGNQDNNSEGWRIIDTQGWVVHLTNNNYTEREVIWSIVLPIASKGVMIQVGLDHGTKVLSSRLMDRLQSEHNYNNEIDNRQ